MGVLTFFLSPYTAVILFIVFLVGFFLYLDIEGSFENGFLHFGPGDKRANTTSFMGVRLDSWSKVLTLYLICFTVGFMTSYYDNTVTQSLFASIYKRTDQVVPYSMAGAYSVTLVDPFIIHSLKIIEFLATLTLQFQFILPLFLGEYLGDLPQKLYDLGQRQYIT
jgi:hypothetical protein